MSPSDEPKNPPRKTIRKILVANRGEIAVRVLRGARDLGIRGAVVYSEPDRRALPVLLADEAYPIGPAASRESYLKGDAIVALAREIGADAIHPGYGFLAENAGFAEACRKAGVIYIGPPAEAIAVMGSKVESRRRMIEAGVPVVPGGQDPLPDLETAKAAAKEVGYPIMLKAAAGGGGKGMRRVENEEALASAYRAARSEAAASFGDDSVYVERFIDRPRHVEIQVLGDQHGRIVSLGERECSLQRRHQKVVEEAPSPVVSSKLRRRMGEAAVRAARAVGYTNAGTVEFLLAADGEFYFLEMNTRLQVEHPVTEMVTGMDLVEAQIRIARGEPMPAPFDRYDWIEPRGHAVEVRLYAEDPFQGFVPSPGKITHLRLPQGPGVRNDCGVVEGGEITIHYDPMIGKLIVWGKDREAALDRLDRALAETRIEGIRTTLPLFRALLADEDFRSGNMDITMLDRKLADGALTPPRSGADGSAAPDSPLGLEDDLPAIAAALAHAERASRRAARGAGSGPGETRARSGWAERGRAEAVGRGSWS